jgi:nanoRNase/pAp phosphatase (c-di-AMP/oligoRNAs hydrolase)
MRIITRGDFDGLTCTVLLSEVETISDIRMVHPKDAQDGKVTADAEDIVVNLPFVLGCGMWFDHHVSEETVGKDFSFRGRFEVAPSCARVIYNFYADKHAKDLKRFAELIEVTDRFDSARLSIDDVNRPQGYVLLALTLDPRSGMGPEFQKYFRWLAEYVKEVSIDKVLEHPEVNNRASRFLTEQAAFLALLKKHSRLEENVIVTDLRGVKEKPAGNRFIVYTLYPEANVEVRLLDGHNNTVVVAVGHSIFNTSSTVNVGRLMAEYGGGGHRGAATAQIPVSACAEKIPEIVARLKGK